MSLLSKIKRNSFLRKSWALFWYLYNFCPSRGVDLIGITGTTGKTTLSFFLKKLIEENQESVGLIGTAGYYLKDKVIYHLGLGPGTTPDPYLLYSLLRKMKKQKIKKIILEVTSFGLTYFRTYPLNFKIAILTNIDYNHHVSFHGSMENYIKTKLNLFKFLNKKALAILPKDSPHFEYFKNNTKAQVISYGFNSNSDYYGEILSQNENELFFRVYKNKQFLTDISLKIPFKENVLNALITIIVGENFRIPLETIKKSIESLDYIPGRLEIIQKNGVKILIDKANTPLAFKNIIEFIKNLKPKNKIVVYGNFGESPLEEREKLAELATNFFDLTIITEDDPLKEDPEKGIEDFLNYVRNKGVGENKYKAIKNREKAILKALNMAQKGDIVAILGRGNEKMLIYKDRKIPFEDKKIVEKFFINNGF